MRCKPSETVQELAARIRQDATTCDPLDEAMRTKFICSVSNEAVLKALFKIKDDELTFTRVVEIATKTEDAAKVAKETAHGFKATGVSKVQTDKRSTNNASSVSSTKKEDSTKNQLLQMWKKTFINYLQL